VPLNLREFDEGMSQLKEVYGDRSYPERRCEKLFNLVRVLERREWLSIVDQLIESSQKAPMGQDIRNVGHAIFEQRHARSKEEQRTRAGCSFCDGSGILSARAKQVDTGWYGFRCPFCDAHRLANVSVNIPLFRLLIRLNSSPMMQIKGRGLKSPAPDNPDPYQENQDLPGPVQPPQPPAAKGSFASNKRIQNMAKGSMRRLPKEQDPQNGFDL
jgi:hypothetical protein